VVAIPVPILNLQKLHSIYLQTKALPEGGYYELPITPGDKILNRKREVFLNAVLPGQILELTQPNYLSGNWSRLMSGADDRLRYVRVLNGVASIFDKVVLIRHALPQPIPNGFYFVDRKFLIPATPRCSFGGARYSYPNHEYPDIECYNPNFSMLSELGKIDKRDVEGMIGVVDRIRQNNGDVVITPTGIGMRQYQDSALSYKQSFGFTPGDLEIYVSGEKFYLALTELLRYDYSYLMIRRIDESSICLVFGHNWDNCVLVSPQGMNRINGQHVRQDVL